MRFTEFFIKHSALTIVISLVMTIVGILSYNQLPIRWIPNISIPVVFVETLYPGANANLVETQVSTPIEAALAGVSGVDSLMSYSRNNESQVLLIFKEGRNIDTAIEDVRTAIGKAILPTDVKQPLVGKADPNNEPIMSMAISDSHRSAEEISDYVRQFILPRLQNIDGVASVNIQGERQPEMRITLDPMKMAASNVTVDDVDKVITEQNMQVPSGQIRGVTRFYNLVMNESLKTPDDFNNLIIRDDQNSVSANGTQPIKNGVIRLKDVGIAAVEAANIDSSFRVNGNAGVGLDIIPQSTANPLAVASSVTKEFNAITKTLPSTMQGKIVLNIANYIHASIMHVYETLIIALLLVLMVIYVFLGSWRAALVPIITIPICLISTFTVMKWLGFSINTITLMAFVLAIGLVVDDAIVMLENISRHAEKKSAFQAAISGSREIIFAVIAMTITLAAVYAPIAFASGMLGAVFSEFALTLAAAVLISGFVALTLSPMMSARILTSVKNNHYSDVLQQVLEKLQERYQQVLQRVLQYKGRILLALAAIGCLGLFCYHGLSSELSPEEDMNRINVYVGAPTNSSFDYIDQYGRRLEAIYKAIPGVDTVISHVNANYGINQQITLLPVTQRSQNTTDIIAAIKDKTKKIAGVNIYVMPSSSPLSGYSSGRHGGNNISMHILSSSDYKTLHNTMEQMISTISKYPQFTFVDNSLKWDSEQFEVTINREKAADMKVAMGDITNTISTLFAGKLNPGHFEYNGNLYDIFIQMNRAALSDPNIISQLYTRNQNNVMVPLSDLVSLHETTSPEQLPHYDRMRSDVLSIMLAPGYSIADGVQALQQIAKNVLPDNAKYEFDGEAKTYLDSHAGLASTFLLAIVFIYLVLVAQFESFIDPFIILLTVPFAVIGALFTLKVTGGSLNVYSEIALVTLIGLIAKHGILITEFANQQMALGKNIEEAVIQAAKLRLRPILMTTAAMVLGALPLAFASGPGAEVRHPIGWVISGGLLFGTFFSLIVIPVAYTYLARFKRSRT